MNHIQQASLYFQPVFNDWHWSKWPWPWPRSFKLKILKCLFGCNGYVYYLKNLIYSFRGDVKIHLWRLLKAAKIGGWLSPTITNFSQLSWMTHHYKYIRCHWLLSYHCCQLQRQVGDHIFWILTSPLSCYKLRHFWGISVFSILFYRSDLWPLIEKNVYHNSRPQLA